MVAMLFCQLAHTDSLREICNGMACCLGKLVNLGIDVAPSKSTLSYANQHRPAKLYEELFYIALARVRDEKGLATSKQKFRFKNTLLSLDSATISLCLEMFPWAKFRRAKGGVKVPDERICSVREGSCVLPNFDVATTVPGLDRV